MFPLCLLVFRTYAPIKYNFSLSFTVEVYVCRHYHTVFNHIESPPFCLSFVYHVPLVVGALFLDLCIFASINQSIIPHNFKHSESDNGIEYVGIQLRRIEFRSRFGKFLLFAFFFSLKLFCFSFLLVQVSLKILCLRIGCTARDFCLQSIFTLFFPTTLRSGNLIISLPYF